MFVGSLALGLLSFALLVTAFLQGSALFSWLSIIVVLAAIVLFITDLVQNRRKGGAAAELEVGPEAEPEAVAEPAPATAVVAEIQPDAASTEKIDNP